MRNVFALLLLAGCPWLGEPGYTDNVRDVDGDGLLAERFGGVDCDDTDPAIGDCDADRDGVRSMAVGGDDCDDGDATTYPGAPERCDGVDHDCDGLLGNDDPDVVDAPMVYLDADRDGFGTDTTSKGWCGDPEPGWVREAYLGDCADSDPERFPGAEERCDALDRDCDGDPTAGAIDAVAWWADDDSDGFGSGAVVAVQCEAPPEAAEADPALEDCAPADASVFPGAPEVPYDGIDQDCSGADLVDVDGDGWAGGPEGSDCDDTQASVSPDEPEVCNGLDDDCDGGVDEGVLLTGFPDADADGHGDREAPPLFACSLPADHVASNDDCDDANPDRSPTDPEVCDGLDNDCDDDIDEDAADAITRYADLDGDLFGDPDNVFVGCTSDLPAGDWLEDALDCDDARASVNPLAIEICDGIDNDCDEGIDDDATDRVLAWVDADDDGQGDPLMPVYVCDAGEGTSLAPSDCDDSDPLTFLGAPEICGDAVRQDCSTVPADDCDGDGTSDALDCRIDDPTFHLGAVEVCDGLDNDCDALIDSADDDVDASTAQQYFLDADGDGVGGLVPLGGLTCDPPPDSAPLQGDCDDDDPDTYPFAPERCDGLDNDCDGTVDDDPAAPPVWFVDGDGDGHGAPGDGVAACEAPEPTGWATSDDDCNDDDPTRSPSAAEVCNQADDDCDGLVDDDDVVDEPLAWYSDDDRDGYGGGAPVLQCLAPEDHVALDGDCDDADGLRSPGAPELCDGIDNDCDGLTDADDPDLAGLQVWYPDDDGDGFGDLARAVESCAPPAGHVALAGDCDDADGQRSPGAPEVCDGLDNDCDGLVDSGDGLIARTWFADADDDGWGDPSTTEQACARPLGFLDIAGDCDDTTATVFPGAAEACDGLDNDCDGLVDTDDPDANTVAWYPDDDGDGDGDGDAAAVVQCAPPAFPASTLAGDCDDTDPSLSSLAEEVCDGLDNDCDGLVDSDDDDVEGDLLYVDADLDSRGDAARPVLACAGPGFAAIAGDCDDTEPAVAPGLTELCDGLDNDCNGEVDDGAGDATQYRYDGDLDGVFGDITVDACSDPDGAGLAWESGLVAIGDCDDDDPTVFPGAPEICDGQRNDCSADLPDVAPDASAAPTFYVDLDGDGFGAGVGTPACSAVPGFVTSAGDCDDTNPAAHPGLPYEDCLTAFDDNCDGTVNAVGSALVMANGALGYTPFDGVTELDGDGDGYVDDALAELAVPYEDCTLPVGMPTALGDCDDTTALVAPFLPETCDGLDNDCDGRIDADDPDLLSASAVDLHLDADRDGTRGAIVGLVCPGDDVPLGFVAFDPALDPDCDDNDPYRFPGYGAEDCDGVDNDCDGLLDPSEKDDDDDRWAECALAAHGWRGPDPVQGGGDCDDQNKDRNPGSVELCDGIDNDCDLALGPDEVDVDGDFYVVCSLAGAWKGAGTVVGGDDCNDLDAGYYPGQVVSIDNRDGDTIQAAVDAICADGIVDVVDSGVDYAPFDLPTGKPLTVRGSDGVPSVVSLGGPALRSFGAPAGTLLQDLRLVGAGDFTAILNTTEGPDNQAVLRRVSFGPVLLDGGGLLLNGSTTDILCEDCTFTGMGGMAGTVAQTSAGASLTLDGLTVTASNTEGGPMVNHNGGDLVVRNATFSDIDLTGVATTAGIWVGSGSVLLDEVTFDTLATPGLEPTVNIAAGTTVDIQGLTLRDTGGGLKVQGVTDALLLDLVLERVGSDAGQGAIDLGGVMTDAYLESVLVLDTPGSALRMAGADVVGHVRYATFVGNGRYGIEGAGGTSVLEVDHTLFHGNALGDYIGYSVTAADNNNLFANAGSLFPGCSNCFVEADPGLITYFPTLPSDLWVPVPYTGQTAHTRDIGHLFGPAYDAFAWYAPSGNSLYDGWELFWFGQIDVNEGNDPDGDGLTTFQEYALWGTSPVLADTDGDGVSDGVEPSTALDCDAPTVGGCP